MRSKHQDRLTQVEQEARARQVSASSKRAQIRALHTPNSQSHYNSGGSYQLESTHWLPPMKPHRLRLVMTKYCKYHHNIGHNIEDCGALKDKIEELIQTGYLA